MPQAIRTWAAVTVLISPLSAVISIWCGPTKRASPQAVLHRVAAELVLQHLDFVVERLLQPRDQIDRADILLDPVGAAVEAALAPAGEIEHGFAQGFRRDRAGMDRNAADPPALFHHQNRLAELGELDGGAAAGRAGADHEHVIIIHRRQRPELRARRLHRSVARSLEIRSHAAIGPKSARTKCCLPPR